MNAVTRARLFGTTCAFVLIGLAAPTLQAQQGPPGDRPDEEEEEEKPLPLEAAREAEINVTRSTWMSVDVSPDGETLVFDLLGSLYTLPIAGGKAARITEGLAFDAQPRFSPDGESVVFVSDRSGGDNVWTMRLDFSDTTQITQGNTSLYISPEWLPDGEHIVVSHAGGLGGAAKLQMYHAQRQSPLPLIREPSGVKTLGAAPSPDGRYIWYAARSGDWEYNAIFPQYQLYRYDRETGTSTQLTSRYGSAFRPRVSPDGRWLAYATRRDAQTGLRLRDLTTGNERWLAYPIQRDDMESRAPLDVLPGYAFTPNSEAIIISYGGEIWRVPVDGSPPTQIPFEVEVQREIGPEVKFAYRVDARENVTAKQIRHPVPSPDGELFAFTAFDRVWITGPQGNEPRRLTDQDGGEFHPVWSPDGTWVAFVTWDDATGGHIMRARADGSGSAEQLSTDAALYYNLAWSPDGERIVASRAAARELKQAPDAFFGPLGGEFVWVPAAGGEANLIAPLGGRDAAHFRTDEPNRIYAYGPSEGLVSFRWDGTDVKQHLQVRGAPPPSANTPHPDDHEFLPRRIFPVSREELFGNAADVQEEGPQAPPAGLVMISPQGGRAVAQVGRDIYTVDIPEVGGPVPTISVANPQSAPVPARQLTDIGGEFPAWSADGERVHWAIGNALVTYDLARIEAVEDSTAEAGRESVRQALRVRALLDSLQVTRSAADSTTEAGEEVPDSLQARLDRLIADSVEVRADSLLRAVEDMRAQEAAIRAQADSVREGTATVQDDTVAYKPAEVRIEVDQPRDIPRGTVVLRGGRVLTMVEHEIIENADVVVTDNRIVAVGPTGEVEVPDDARIIDVAGKTLTPGFVDTHYHAQWLVPEIHSRQVWQYLATLAYGVTTTRDPQTATTDILSYQDRVETGGMVGPRIYSTGPGVFISENIRDADHAKRVLKRYGEYWDTKTLKMYMSGNRQQRQWIIGAAKELELMPTTEGGLDFKLNLTHAIDGYPGIEHALPIAPIYEDVVQLFKASQTTNSPTLLVSYGGPFGENYFYVKEDVNGDPKLRRFMPKASLDSRTRRRGPGAGGSPGQAGWFLDEEHVFPKHAEFVANLLHNGARAAVGSHGQLQGLGYHWELWAMASGGIPDDVLASADVFGFGTSEPQADADEEEEGGVREARSLSPHDALRAATIFGAEAIGLDQDLGTIEADKLADILVFDSDPLENLRNTGDLQYVMKNGRLYEGETLDEVWPRERPLPEPHWRRLGPEGVRAGIR